MMAEYTYAKNPTAPRRVFTCPNCGEDVVRRLSEVKNENLVFCNNKCRAEYNQKLALIKNGLEFDNDIISQELADMNKIIKWTVHYMANKFGRYDDLEELEQIARITVWKNYKKAHNGEGKPESFYISCIKNAITNSFTRTSVFEKLDDFERDLQHYDTPEHIAQQNEIINNLYSKKARSYQMLLASALEGLSHEEIAEKFKCKIRDVSVNIYNAKKLMGVV